MLNFPTAFPGNKPAGPEPWHGVTCSELPPAPRIQALPLRPFNSHDLAALPGAGSGRWDPGNTSGLVGSEEERRHNPLGPGGSLGGRPAAMPMSSWEPRCLVPGESYSRRSR